MTEDNTNSTVSSLSRHRNRDVIQTLKELLAMAEAGEIHSILGAADLGNNKLKYIVAGEYRQRPAGMFRPVSKLLFHVQELDEKLSPVSSRP